MRRDAQQLVETYADLITRVSYTYIRNIDDAQDICHDVLLKLITNNTTFESEEHERAWVVRTTINTCKNLLTSARQRLNTPLDNAPEQATASADTSDITHALAELPSEYHEVIYLHYYEGYPISLIAQLHNTTEGAITMRLHRARTQLRTILEGVCNV